MGRKLVASLLAATVLSGCVTSGSSQSAFGPNKDGSCEYDTTAYVLTGAVIGTTIGLLLGGKKNRGAGAAIGAGVGALAGKGVESYLTNRCKQLALAKQRMKSSEVEARSVVVDTKNDWANPNITSNDDRQEENGVSVTVNSPSMFPVGSPTLSETGRSDMEELARAFNGSNRKILIVGNTDSTGSSEVNQRLSEQRAVSVARVFGESGIPVSNIFYKGAGETRPVASNETEEGRAKNRRVEVIELESENGVLAYEDRLDTAIENLILPTPDPVPNGGNTDRAQNNETVDTPDIETAPNEQIAAGSVLAVRDGEAIDFGGIRPTTDEELIAKAVGIRENGNSALASLSLIGSAFASDEQDAKPNLAACISDEYEAVAEIKSLSTGEPVKRKTNEYLPGLYSTSWSDTINGHLVGLTKIAVLRDGSVPQNPDTYVFKDYEPSNQTPFISASGQVRSYFGTEGALYRIFYEEDAWPLRCVDLVFSRKSPGTTSYGRLYYDKQGEVFSASFKPQIFTTN